MWIAHSVFLSPPATLPPLPVVLGLLPRGPFTQIQAFLFFACDLLSLTRTICEAEFETIQGSLVGSLFHTQSKAMTVPPPESIRIDRRRPFWPFLTS